MNIYAISPADGAETEKRFNNSNSEHKQNFNRLGSNMLRTTGETENQVSDDSDDSDPVYKR